MAEDRRPNDCPDCAEGISRRDFVKTVGTAAVVGGLYPLLGSPRRAVAAAARAAAPKGAAETAAKRFYDSLSAEQRKAICFPFDHPLRKRINANWAITEMTIEDDLTKEQQELAREIFRGVTSHDGYERFLKQMDEDQGGFGSYHVAVFGEPGSGQFEWELTGRHVTIRADGDSVEGAAFGGPIVYGHGAGDSTKGLPGNVFYYQTQKANEVFKALDGKQRERALVPQAPPESAVAIQGTSGKFPGIGVDQLSSDQKELVESVIKVILAPYREQDVEEAMALMKAGGGLDALHMAFYEAGDVGKDQEWDIWRLEGPTLVWHFRGAPHVHAYVNIHQKA
ncbi:MAG TPA: DUF3500 domain-containing protein [Isosphaeraceae bacterium]